ncbi:hypothetical protein FRC17_009108 [Serendipita sp. 399]|nr:hypothetical protein FRC17_009108 [Serendipita sp. 399]
MFPRIAWSRLTQNRHAKKVFGNGVTTLFTATSIIYCFVHLLTLVSAWDANNASIDLLGEVLTKASINVNRGFPYLESSKEGGDLRFCPKGISGRVSPKNCPVLFPLLGESTVLGANTTLAKRQDDLTMIPVFQGQELTSFMLLEASRPGEVITLTPTCLQGLQWPYQVLRQTRRADTVVALYQIWLLMISAAAIFCQCIPHVMAATAMHLLSLVWSSYQVTAFSSFRADYSRIISSINGACNGVDLLPTYFQSRMPYVIAVTVLDSVTLLVSAYLSWRLVPLYGWATFTKTSASPVVTRAYNFTQAISSVASVGESPLLEIYAYDLPQLTAFFYIASVSIWLDEITKHLMGARPSHLSLFLGLYISSIVLIVPWLVSAWFGIRRENRWVMSGFFALSMLYIIGSGVMFKSNTFKQSFVFWPFLGAMFTTSFTLIVITFVLAILCSLHFGYGLAQRQTTRDNGTFGPQFSPVVDEKGDLEKLSLPLSAEAFVIAFPGEERLENPPQRSDSMSSTSTKASRQSTTKKARISRMPVMAALPGAIKITPPPQAVTVETTTPLKSTNSIKAKAMSSWRYASEQAFWNRTRRHESAVSWGHMDPSQLDAGSVQSSDLSKVELALQTPLVAPVAQQPLTSTGMPKVGLPAHPAALRQVTRLQPKSRLDSVGSISSEQLLQQQRLFLVTPQ